MDSFHRLPRLVRRDGRDVPITVDIDIKRLDLSHFKQFVPKQDYYEGETIYNLITNIGANSIISIRWGWG